MEESGNVTEPLGHRDISACREDNDGLPVDFRHFFDQILLFIRKSEVPVEAFPFGCRVESHAYDSHIASCRQPGGFCILRRNRFRPAERYPGITRVLVVFQFDVGKRSRLQRESCLFQCRRLVVPFVNDQLAIHKEPVTIVTQNKKLIFAVRFHTELPRPAD